MTVSLDHSRGSTIEPSPSKRPRKAVSLQLRSPRAVEARGEASQQTIILEAIPTWDARTGSDVRPIYLPTAPIQSILLLLHWCKNTSPTTKTEQANSFFQRDRRRLSVIASDADNNPSEGPVVLIPNKVIVAMPETMDGRRQNFGSGPWWQRQWLQS